MKSRKVNRRGGEDSRKGGNEEDKETGEEK